MKLTREQIEILLKAVANTSDDPLNCDHCFNYAAQFVETKLTGKTLCESMKLLQNHLENCDCCEREFQALLAAMSEVGDVEVEAGGAVLAIGF